MLTYRDAGASVGTERNSVFFELTVRCVSIHKLQDQDLELRLPVTVKAMEQRLERYL